MPLRARRPATGGRRRAGRPDRPGRRRRLGRRDPPPGRGGAARAGPGAGLGVRRRHLAGSSAGLSSSSGPADPSTTSPPRPSPASGHGDAEIAAAACPWLARARRPRRPPPRRATASSATNDTAGTARVVFIDVDGSEATTGPCPARGNGLRVPDPPKIIGGSASPPSTPNAYSQVRPPSTPTAPAPAPDLAPARPRRAQTPTASAGALSSQIRVGPARWRGGLTRGAGPCRLPCCSRARCSRS